MSGKNKGGREVRKPKQPKGAKGGEPATQLAAQIAKPVAPKQGKPGLR